MPDHPTHSRSPRAQPRGDWKERVRERLGGLDLDPATEAETIEEVTQHVEDRYCDLLSAGVLEDAAATQAWRELEGHPRLASEISGVRRFASTMPIQDTSRGGLGPVWEDFRFAWRRLVHSPGFALVALVTITLTIGANTAILGVADAVLFRPLPYADPDGISIVQMQNRQSGARSTMTPYAMLQAINDGAPSVSEVAVLGAFAGNGRAAIQTADGTRPVPLMTATPNYFELLGARPHRGRIFSAADAGGEDRLAVLSRAAWQQYFGSDPAVIGRSVALGEVTLDVIGVLPAGFVFPSLFTDRLGVVVLGRPLAPGRKGGALHAVVRTQPGVSREQAQAEVDTLTLPVARELGREGSLPVLDAVRAVLYPVGRPVMRYLLAAAAFILLLGCANLANMMLVRGRRDLRETAVRLALGASRTRLVRPVVFEALIIGVGGAILAVALTLVTFDALLQQVPPAVYGFGRTEVGVSGRIAAMALVMGLACGLAFSVVPAWRASGVDVLPLIQRRAGRRGRSRRGGPLVAVQVAIALAVACGAAVAARAFVSVLQTPLGFSPDHVLRIGLGVPRGEADRQAYYERAVRMIAARPDVLAAGAGGALPFSGATADEGASAPGMKTTVAGIVHVLPGYFEAVGIALDRGRLLTWDDVRADPNAAIVSKSAARALFQDREPIGGIFTNGRDREFRVVGVVGDVVDSLNEARRSQPQVYVIPGSSTGLLSIMARVRARSDAVVAGLRFDLRQIPAAFAPSIDWWSDRIISDSGYRDPRFQTIVLVGLAAIALGLTALGIFSVVAYLVAARTREMGVRLAIGASPSSLVAMVVRESLVPVGVGFVAGAVLILWGRRLAEAQLFKVETGDPAMIAVAVATVTCAALCAAYLPARRATRINPTEVLRSE